MLGDDPNTPDPDFNPYQVGVEAHLPDRVAPGQTDPRAKRAAVLGGLAAGLYCLPPVAIVLGVIAMDQAKHFLSDWLENPELRGRGAAIAGKALGIGSILVAIFMCLYYLWIFLEISKTRSSLPY